MPPILEIQYRGIARRRHVRTQYGDAQAGRRQVQTDLEKVSICRGIRRHNDRMLVVDDLIRSPLAGR